MIPFACSGPGAAEAIWRSEVLGWILLAGSWLTVAGAVWARARLGTPARSWGTAIGALLALSHPGWWLSARMGDCGTTRDLGTLGWSGVVGLWLLIAVGVAAVRRRRLRTGP